MAASLILDRDDTANTYRVPQADATDQERTDLSAFVEHRTTLGAPMIMRRRKIFTPYLNGSTPATGDGVADDTAAIQAMLLSAALQGGYAEVDDGDFSCIGYLWVHNGLKEIRGAGGKIIFAGAEPGGVRTVAKGTVQNGQPAAAANASELKIKDVIVDAGGIVGHAISPLYLWNVRDCVVERNTIINIAEGTAITVWNTGVVADGECEDIVIRDNVIPLGVATQTASVYGVAVASVLTYTNPHVDQTAQWQALKVAAVPTRPAKTITVSNNRIDGGYYAVSMVGTHDSEVTDNTCSNNTRNVNLQNGSERVTVAGNNLSESISSSVHMAFACHDNRVVDNVVHTDSANSEGLLQAYIDCNDNLFARNAVYSGDGAGGARHAVNIAVHCNRNRVLRNDIKGHYARSVLCLESAWNSASPDADSRASGLGTVVDDYADEASADNELSDNRLDIQSATPSAIYLHQGDDAVSGTCGLTGTVLSRNAVLSDTVLAHLRMTEDTTDELTTVQMRNNEFPLDSVIAEFIMPRGPNHFSSRKGNTIIDEFDAHGIIDRQRFVAPDPVAQDETVGTVTLFVEAGTRIRVHGSTGGSFWGYAKLTDPDGVTDVTVSGMTEIWRWPDVTFGGLGRYTYQAVQAEYAEIRADQAGTLQITMQAAFTNAADKACRVIVRGP